MRRAALPCAAALLIALSAGAAERTATVAKGETLRDVAARTLQDADAASELAALNGLAAGKQPKKNAVLVLPGPERTRATEAIAAAAKRLHDAKADARKRGDASLARAREALRAARYTEAEALARAAADDAEGVTRFRITVDEGVTRFVVEQGALDVTSKGTTASASAGQAVRASGAAAPQVSRGPAAPRLLEPGDGGEIASLEAQLAWDAVKGAARYRVAVARDLDFRERVATVPVDTTALVLPPSLPKGVYYWKVAAVATDGTEGIASAPRAFRVTREPGQGDEWRWGPIWDPWGRGIPGVGSK